MSFKKSAHVAIVALSALAGFGASALAGDKASAAGAWTAPNEPGMPGYTEPPKVKGEARLPNAVPTEDASSDSYSQKKAVEGGK